MLDAVCAGSVSRRTSRRSWAANALASCSSSRVSRPSSGEPQVKPVSSLKARADAPQVAHLEQPLLAGVSERCLRLLAAVSRGTWRKVVSSSVFSAAGVAGSTLGPLLGASGTHGTTVKRGLRETVTYRNATGFFQILG